MQIVEEHIKLKKGETALVLCSAERWSKYEIAVKQIGVNRFGEFYERDCFGGYYSYKEAVETIKRSIYKPKFLIIKRQMILEFSKQQKLLWKFYTKQKL